MHAFSNFYNDKLKKLSKFDMYNLLHIQILLNPFTIIILPKYKKLYIQIYRYKLATLFFSHDYDDGSNYNYHTY